MDEEIIEHPVEGRLVIKRSLTNATGFVDVSKDTNAKNEVVYYGKTRLNLNFSQQTKIARSPAR